MRRRDKAQGLTEADVPPGTCLKAVVGDKEVAVFNVDGQLYATQNDCTHWGGPLCEGSLVGEVVTCPWHGSQFNVRTGEIVQDPAEKPIATYPVEVRDGVLVLGQRPRVPSEAEELGEVAV